MRRQPAGVSGRLSASPRCLPCSASRPRFRLRQSRDRRQCRSMPPGGYNRRPASRSPRSAGGRIATAVESVVAPVLDGARARRSRLGERTAGHRVRADASRKRAGRLPNGPRCGSSTRGTPSTSVSSATTAIRHRSSSPTAVATRRSPTATASSSSSTLSSIGRTASSSAPALPARSTTGSSSTRGRAQRHGVRRRRPRIGGAGGGFNQNWDGVWQVRTAISEVGWTAEFAIPFRTLRFPSGREQTWGVNFQRNIRRRNEQAYWAPLPRQYDLFRVSLAGRLGGVRAPEGLWRTLQMTPYVIGETVNRADRPDGRMLALGDFGGRPEVRRHVRAGPRPDLQHRLRTGRGGRPADQPRSVPALLSREAPVLPGERGAFTVTNSGSAAFNDPGQTDLFFSRRIGIGGAGQAIPILGGARLSGRVSEDVTVGFLSMQTEAVDSATPANNFTVARLRHDLPNRSSIGGLLVSRQATGTLAGSDNYNRTYAFDGRWGFGQNGPGLGVRGQDRDAPSAAAGTSTRITPSTWRSTTTPRRGACAAASWRWAGTSIRRSASSGAPGFGRWTSGYSTLPGRRPTGSGFRSCSPTSRSNPFLGHRDRLHPDLPAPHGQRLGVRGQLKGDYRLERPQGRRDPPVHDLRRARGPRVLRLARDQPQTTTRTARPRWATGSGSSRAGSSEARCRWSVRPSTSAAARH